MGREQVGHKVGCDWGRMVRGDISFVSVGGHWPGVWRGVRIYIESVMVRSGISGEWDRDGLGRANVRRRRCARISVVWAAAVFRLGYGGMRGSNLGVVRREL
jgi:hypothetical protein